MRYKYVASADSGVVSAFVLGLMMTFVVCAGLGVDGGRLVASRLELADHAENAARVGAQELTDLRSGDPTIDESQARHSVSSYLAAYDLDGKVATTSNSVSVTVTREIDMTLLKLFGATNHLLTVTRTVTPSDH
jgi:Flp pilus assembly protein TadG